MDGDHIHIAFGDNQGQALAHRYPCQRHTIKRMLFLEGRAFSRIEIFGLLIIIQRPRTKGNHLPAIIRDRKHQAMTEHLIPALVTVRNTHQPCFDNLIGLMAKLHQGFLQTRPWRKPQAKGFNRALINAAFFQVSRSRVIPLHQRRLILPRGFIHDHQRFVAFCRNLRVLRL